MHTINNYTLTNPLNRMPSTRDMASNYSSLRRSVIRALTSVGAAYSAGRLGANGADFIGPLIRGELDSPALDRPGALSVPTVTRNDDGPLDG